jgi:GNAT superfamily N-acetyltransferase
MTSAPRPYPRHLHCDDTEVLIAPMAAGDRDAIAAFVAALPAHDLLFLRRDIGHPKVLAAWFDALTDGRISSLVARDSEQIVGCTALVTDALSWSRHVGELRVLVAPAWRGRGLGRALIQECFAQALERGLDKLCAQMTVDQSSAIAVYEGLGFRAEALLRGHVQDREGRRHDLALLSHDVAAVQATMSAYGITDALDAQGED